MRRSKTDAEIMQHLWSKVSQQDGHWLWQGHKQGGYGRLTVNGKRIMAHRLMYQLTFGPIPEGLVIDHLCRVRNCLRPSHMEPVTVKENILRGEAPTAKYARQTHCKNGHPLSGSNLRVGKMQRHCRKCHADLTLRRYHEKKGHVEVSKGAL